MQKRNTLNALIILSVLFVFFSIWACQSDSNTASKDGEATSSFTDASQTTDGVASVDDVSEQQDFPAKAHELDQKLDKFHSDLLALRKEVDAIPQNSKNNAVDYGELEARFEGYLEKGTYLQEEVKQVAEQLEQSGKAGAADDMTSMADAGADLDVKSKLQEQEKSVAEMNQAMAIMQQAVQKLKNAKGSKVVLFE